MIDLEESMLNNTLGEVEDSTDYFVPELLHDLISEAEQDARAVLDTLNETPEGGIVDTSALVATNAEARQKLQLDRGGRFGLMFETLTDKYDNALRTDALMKDVAAGRGFVLFLRGFSMKRVFRQNITTGSEADMGEYDARFELARTIAPTPIVMVRNPAVSESLIGQFDGATEAAKNTFAIDLDDHWERDVESLVRTASYIIVRNALPGPGLDAELDMLRRFGRLNDTFFSASDATDLDIGGATGRLLDNDALARMRSTTSRPLPEGVQLPSPPTCLWIQGERRRRVGDNVFFTFDFLNKLADSGKPMPRDMQGRLLFSTVAASIGLERLDLLIMTLSSYAQVVSQYRPDELPSPGRILGNYGNILNAVAQAIDAVDADKVLDFRNVDRLQHLMGEAEDAIRLVRTTMSVIERLELRLALSNEAQ